MLMVVCPRRDSNPEPTDYESAALTVELQGHTNFQECPEILTENLCGCQKRVPQAKLRAVSCAFVISVLCDLARNDFAERRNERKKKRRKGSKGSMLDD